MFAHFKNLGLPAGPYAEPSTVYTLKSGKYHLDSRCRDRLEPTQVVLWDVGRHEFCSKCSFVTQLPHYQWHQTLKRLYALWHDLQRQVDVLERDPSRTTPTESRYPALLDRNAALVLLLSGLPGNATDGVTDPAALEWIDSTLKPRIREVQSIAQAQLPVFTGNDWHLRFVAQELLRNEGEPMPPTAGIGTQLGLDDGVYRDIREGITARWFATASSPSVEELAQAGLAAVTEDSLSAQGPPRLAQLSADPGEYAPPVLPGELLVDYLNRLWAARRDGELSRVAHTYAGLLLEQFGRAERSPATLVRWEDAYGVSSGPSGSTLAGALISMGTAHQVLDNTIMAVVPQAVADVLTTSSRRKRLKCRVTSFGPVAPDDTAEVFATAHLLSSAESSDTPYECLRLARMAHIQAA